MKNQFIINAQTQFLRDTVRHFNSYNRAASGGGCVYSETEFSSGCALGRHIVNKELCRELDDDPEEITGVVDVRVFEKLPGQLAMLGQDFLKRVQSLHDTEILWGPWGLSPAGETRVDEICKACQLNVDEVFCRD